MVQQYFDVYGMELRWEGGAEFTHNVTHNVGRDRTKYRFIRLKSS